jgi:two-component system, OmpR family, response regulator
MQEHAGMIVSMAEPARSTGVARKVSGPAAMESARSEPPRTVNVLVVDVGRDLAELLAESLRVAGYVVNLATSSEDAMAEVERVSPGAVVLDVGPRDASAFELVRRLRSSGISAPIIYLMPKHCPRKNSARLTVGGSRYLVKPFSLDDLAAQVRSALRRSGILPRADAVLRLADLEFDEETGRVRRAGREIRLAPAERKILRYLLLNSGAILTRTQIVDHVWPYDFTGSSRALDVHICMIRRKVDRIGPPLIHTVHRVGYCVRIADI